MDDLLAERGLQVVGAGAVHGVALHHPGLLLCPIDVDQLRAAGEELQVGAVLVPLASIGGSSDEDEDEDEEGSRGGGGGGAER